MARLSSLALEMLGLRSLALEMLGLRDLVAVLALALVLELVVLVLVASLEDSELEVVEEKLGRRSPRSFSLITSFPVISFRIFICSLKSSCK
jgi:hypothetical protein